MDHYFDASFPPSRDPFLKRGYLEKATTCPAILLVEDNEADQMSIERCFKKCETEIELITASNGYDALGILSDRREQQIVVLTDINMPGINGLELLFEIRKDVYLRKNPVFVISSSHLPKDIAEAYEYGATGYIQKRDTMNELQQIVAFMINYCEMMELPQPNDIYLA